MGVVDRVGNDVGEQPRPRGTHGMRGKAKDVRKLHPEEFERVLPSAREIEGERLLVVKRFRQLVGELDLLR